MLLLAESVLQNKMMKQSVSMICVFVAHGVIVNIVKAGSGLSTPIFCFSTVQDRFEGSRRGIRNPWEELASHLLGCPIFRLSNKKL
jgi:hypothetical protein